jgi:hypothetical protein
MPNEIGRNIMKRAEDKSTCVYDDMWFYKPYVNLKSYEE